MSCGCPSPCPPEPELRVPIDEPCSVCAPFPHVIPCDFSNDNQKHWIVAEAWKNGTPLMWNPDTSGFHSIQAVDADNPELVIDPEVQHIDGCGCPPKVTRIEPAGSISCEPEDFSLILPSTLHCSEQDSGDFIILPFSLLPDTLECQICDKPPILKAV